MSEWTTETVTPTAPATAQEDGRDAIRVFIEQMDMFEGDYGKYVKGDRSMPFVTLRESMASAIECYVNARAAMLTSPDSGKEGV